MKLQELNKIIKYIIAVRKTLKRFEKLNYLIYSSFTNRRDLNILKVNIRLFWLTIKIIIYTNIG